MKKVISTKVVYDKRFCTVDRCKKKPCNVRTIIVQTLKVYKYFWMSCPKRDITFTISQNDPGSKTRTTLQSFLNSYPRFYKYFTY